MKKIILCLILLSFQNLFAAQNFLKISDAIIKIQPPGTSTTSLFFTIKNNSNSSVNLTSISSAISDSIELHEMNMEGGKMEMRTLDKLTIPPHESLVLKSGSMHVMVFNLKKMLKLKDQIQFIAFFDNKEKVEFNAIATKFD